MAVGLVIDDASVIVEAVIAQLEAGSIPARRPERTEECSGRWRNHGHAGGGFRRSETARGGGGNNFFAALSRSRWPRRWRSLPVALAVLPSSRGVRSCAPAGGARQEGRGSRLGSVGMRRSLRRPALVAGAARSHSSAACSSRASYGTGFLPGSRRRLTNVIDYLPRGCRDERGGRAGIESGMKW